MSQWAVTAGRQSPREGMSSLTFTFLLEFLKKKWLAKLNANMKSVFKKSGLP